MSIALTLTVLGLYAALAHLAKPRLAPHALRNLTASWLSREVLLVQAFAGAVALLILISLLDTPSGLVILEAAACLLGGAALFAMTRVYLLKTVPVWNSPATLLEFAGSAFTKLTGGLVCKCDKPESVLVNTDFHLDSCTSWYRLQKRTSKLYLPGSLAEAHFL
jgi:DMSO reductase anchor subunit